MLNPIDRQVRLRFTRRDWLTAGCASVIGLPALRPQMTQAAAGVEGSLRRAKSVILILLTGGASQHETFDLKPEAPVGIRGDFRPIDTAVSGIQICEHLPLLAERARHYALVRSMSHREPSHLPGTHK